MWIVSTKNTVSKTPTLQNNFDRGNRWYTSDFKAFSHRREAFFVLNAILSIRKIIIHLSAFIVATVVSIVGFVLSLVVRAMLKKLTKIVKKRMTFYLMICQIKLE